MTKTYYEKFIAGKDKPVSDGMTEMAREDSAARWDELRNRAMGILPDEVLQANKEKHALTKQIGGNHYKDMKIQPVEFITANNLTFLEGNVVKYISRHHAKNGADDVKKAIHYCELILKTVYGV